MRAERSTEGRVLAGLLAAMVAVRLAPVLAADFPLGDGGLFAVMAQDLRNSGFALPAFTTYNDGTIPFVYPPLGIYLLAAIPGDPVATERWLPLVYSLGAVLAAWLLARELTTHRAATVAVIVFAAMPVTWAIEGGGVTRALGFALLLVALWRVAVLVRAPRWTNVLLAGLPAGLALLTHPSVGPVGVASALVFLARRYSARAALAILAAGVVAAIMSLAWLVPVIGRHGVEPLAMGIGAHGQAAALVRLLTTGPSWLGSLDPVLPAAVVGAAIALRRGEWLVPVWLVVLFLVPGGEGRFAALAWAILAAQAALLLIDALRPLGAHRAAVAGLAVLLFVASLIASYQLFQPVPAGVRQAMREATAGSDPSATFRWVPTKPDDQAVEWFPVITGRSNETTYFGYEWTDQWEQRLELYRQALRETPGQP